MAQVDISDSGSLFDILVPFLICLCISFMLYGLGTAQTLYYLSRPGNDPLWIRWMVLVVWLVDTAHSVLMARAEIFYTVFAVKRVDMLASVDWSVTIVLALQAAIVLIVQSFYVRRVWLLSNRSKLIVSLPASLLPCRIAAMITLAVFSYKNQWINLRTVFPYELITEISLAFGIVVDFAVTAPMLWYLRSSQTKFARTHGALRSLMVFSLNTGLLVMLVSAAVMFTYIRLNNYLLFAGLYGIGGKLYVNSLLGTLSARKVIQEKMYSMSGPRIDIHTPRHSTSARSHSTPSAQPLSSSFSSPGSHGTSETIHVNGPVASV